MERHQAGVLEAALATKLATVQANMSESLSDTQSLAVGLSGGPDSSALAICLDQWCRRRPGKYPDNHPDNPTDNYPHNPKLYLFHVHHGLSDLADEWQARAQALADLLERPLMVRRINVELDSGLGVEAAARQARRQALIEMAHEHHVPVVALGHHQHDQAETVLMRLFRGSGIDGLAAMAAITHERGVCWVRPWLEVSRQAILEYIDSFSQRTGWLPVQDPSNTDSRLARGTLRTEVIPAIESHWPAWRTTLARHARQAAQVSAVLERYGQRLLKELVCDPQPTDHHPDSSGLANSALVLSLAKWRELQADEQALVIRVWLDQAGMQMPTEKRLNELLRQLRQVHALGHDRALSWKQRDGEIRCIRGQLHLRATL